MKHAPSAGLLIALLVAALVMINLQNGLPTARVEIGGLSIDVDIADSESERLRGLSGRPSLEPSRGMWFVFDQEDRHGIWMKDMKFAIDVIWLDSSYRVVDLTPNITPNTYPATFRPKVAARYVLEVNAGTISQNKIKIEDSIKITI